MEQDVAMLFPPEVLAQNADDEAKKPAGKDTVFAPLDALMASVRKNPNSEVSHVVVGAKTEEAGGISIEARIGFMAGGQAAQSVAGIQGSLGDVAGMVSKGLPGSAYAMAMTAMIPAGYGPWLAAALASNGVKSTPERRNDSRRLARRARGAAEYSSVPSRMTRW